MAQCTDNVDFEAEIESFRQAYDAIFRQIGRVIVGHREAVEQVLTCLLSDGHVLLEGVPGIGKTLLVRTLGDVLALSFSRIQFTPDLMPADITGTNIVATDESGSKRFEFQPGPVFANLVLADEINRATPKTQSAVLEAMQEQTVSVARTTHRLPRPFFVLATQNPLEMEGTYPLPEAQLDRFLYKVLVGVPPAEDLVTILDRTTGADSPRAEAVADGQQIERMRSTVRRVAAASAVRQYIARVVQATHPKSPGAPSAAARYVRYGASPRGGQAMMLGAKVRALCRGRAHVAFDDVRAVVCPSLRHRLILSFEGQAEGIDPDEIVRQVVASVPEPS